MTQQFPIPIKPEDFQTQYNNEVSAISEIEGTTEEIILEIRKRILDYGDKIHSFQAKQSAGINYIQQIEKKLSVEKRESLRLKDLLYKPQAPKAPRSTKKKSPEQEAEKAIKSLAKQLKWYKDDGSLDLDRVKKEIYGEK